MTSEIRFVHRLERLRLYLKTDYMFTLMSEQCHKRIVIYDTHTAVLELTRLQRPFYIVLMINFC